MGTGVASATASTRVVGQHLVEVAREAGAGERRRDALAVGLGGVAAPRELRLRQRREVAGDVRAPVAEAGDGDAQWAFGRHALGQSSGVPGAAIVVRRPSVPT